MKPMKNRTWHLPGNSKGDLQVTLPQDCDSGHCHLQLVLLLEVALGVGGQSDDVPFPCNLAVRVGCESGGAGRGCPPLGTEPGHPQAMGQFSPLWALKSLLRQLRRSWVTAPTWV